MGCDVVAIEQGCECDGVGGLICDFCDKTLQYDFGGTERLRRIESDGLVEGIADILLGDDVAGYGGVFFVGGEETQCVTATGEVEGDGTKIAVGGFLLYILRNRTIDDVKGIDDFEIGGGGGAGSGGSQ